jgi:predicted phage-related endonuclease
MQIHELTQGTPDWCAFRLQHHGASEAAAMLGLSTKVKRSELLRMKSTGLGKEFTDWVQEHILDHGHVVEALARPLIEEIIGTDLYPVTCSLGRLSASCDGLDMSETIAFEHKQWNTVLATAVAAGELPVEHQPQCQQIMLVTGAERVIFTVSDGTLENRVYMDVLPDQAWFDRIRAGWTQFDIDLENYIPVDIQEKPEGKAVIELPTLYLQAEGRLINSNMEAFGNALAAHLVETRKMVYVTDQDFADADKRAKLYRETCEKLALTKKSMLSQTVSIDEAFRMIDAWHEDLRLTALQIEKDSKKNKESKQINILNEGKIGFTAYVETLTAGIAPIRLQYTMPNFAEAIKGKRLFSAMHDAVQTVLANAKIDLSQVAAGIAANLKWMETHEAYQFLLNDLQTIVYKPADDFQLLVISRISEHKQREADRLEAERQRIQREEAAKAKAAQDKINAEAESAKAIADAKAAAAIKEAQDKIAAEAEAQKVAAEKLAADQLAFEKKQQEAAIQPVAQVKSIYAPVAEVAGLSGQKTEKPTLTLGKIGTRLGFTLTADFLRTIGFEPAGRERAAVLYHESDWLRICYALVSHIEGVRNPR